MQKQRSSKRQISLNSPKIASVNSQQSTLPTPPGQPPPGS